MNKLKEKLKLLPVSAGVYFHKDLNGNIIYIGKAANLKNRVRSYFQSVQLKDTKTQALVKDIDDIEWIEVDSEIDALFLESEMIKRYKPRYNILLRDDKNVSYVCIKQLEIPFITITRLPDGEAECYGPFYSITSIRKALKILRKAFPYYDSPNLPRKNNLDSQLGLTPNLENLEKNTETYNKTLKKYKDNLKKIAKYLKGQGRDIYKEIELEMVDFANNYNFELAIQKRNQLNILKGLNKQVLFSQDERLDISKDEALAQLSALFGLGKVPRTIECYDISHISGSDTVGSMVVFSNGVSDRKRYRKFKLINKNNDFESMKELILRRFSSSSINTTPDIVIIDGGMNQLEIVFNAIPKNIITIGIAKRNEEIIIHKLKSNINQEILADIKKNKDIKVTIDQDFYIINLHPKQKHNYGHAKNLLGDNNSKYNDLTKLIQRIRDESHRFAINYHRQIRTKSQIRNELEDIDGIGTKTRRILLKHFKSISKIKDSSFEEVAQIIGKDKARKIKNHFK